jgi:glyoxylase-like metal-dependent hydrolase (beta-lactamase superfamily II)
MSNFSKNGLNIDIVNVGIIGTNCYIIYNDKKEAIVIDAGDDAHKIYNKVEELGVKVVALMLTHGHFDHISAVDEVAQHYGVTVYAGKGETRLLTDAKMNGSAYYRRDKTVSEFEKLEDNGDIELGGIKFKVMFTPGHTEGSVCYYVEDAKVLFSGDTLFKESVGRTDMATGDDKKIIESLDKLMELDDDVDVYPGHSEESTIGYERRFNPYINRG